MKPEQHKQPSPALRSGGVVGVRPRRRAKREWELVCDLVGCRGGREGCTSSMCRDPKWRKVLPTDDSKNEEHPNIELSNAGPSALGPKDGDSPGVALK